ncbi:hypothetical protein HCB37_04360 [Listeria booriae]|uniref:hypothetical protein n=1 Tax=Listeria booriae TaxID=1552123 RepID=UPI0016255036|nr:hypothetical protein [Listeria booriae]MBC1230496.1 hypothetical protein [Listeria booriae]MBC2048255.1 hypothetical protein [Listeria booriae]MBC2263746.1 hypothetical protein [Listeria booriae]
MATTIIKNTELYFDDEQKYENFMSRVDGTSKSTNEYVRKTREEVRKIKSINLNGVEIPVR